jgi:hypothetical protein
MFGMKVFQHCPSGQRSRISKVSIKVLDSLCVCAGTTDESRASVISTDAVHNMKSTTSRPAFNVIRITLWLMVRSRWALYQCPRRRPSTERSLKTCIQRPEVLRVALGERERP